MCNSKRGGNASRVLDESAVIYKQLLCGREVAVITYVVFYHNFSEIENHNRYEIIDEGFR